MKKIIFSVVVILCGFIVTPTFAQDTVYGEYISEFNSDITINDDATIDIVEEIHYILDVGSHGIYWTVPVDYQTKFGFKRTTDFKLNNVTYYPASNPSIKRGSYERTDSMGWVELKIGDADTVISGEYVYVIDYTLRDAGISFIEDHDEVYLNIIGPGWEVPILEANATIHAPVSDTKRVCYTGTDGSTDNGCTISDTSDGITISTDDALGSYEGLTMALGFPVGTIENNQGRIWFQLLLANLGILIPIPVLVIMLRKLKKNWKNEKITVIPHYDAPDDIDPLLAGYIYLTKYDKKHLTALIIWMATKGYISIEKDGNKTFINKESVTLNGMDGYIVNLFNALFKTSDRVNMSKLPNDFIYKIQSSVASVTKEAKTQGYIDSKRVNTKSALLIVGILVVTFTFTTGMAILLAFAAVGTAIGLIISGIILIIMSVKVDLRTADIGEQMYAKLEGLKMYINTAEKHRIEFHNDPEKFRGVFEKLLPYAIIFGLEKKWVEEFKDLYKDVTPDWYRGNMNAFDLYMINRSISRLNSGIASASARTYGSSSGFRSSGWSSGGSGFSGGSSGGGGGGSGGGSW